MSSFCYLLRVMFSFSHEYIFLFLGAIKLNCLIILHTDTKVKILMGMSSCFLSTLPSIFFQNRFTEKNIESLLSDPIPSFRY